MPYYNVKCGDGSDRNCRKQVEVFIDVERLTKHQLNDVEEEGGTEITKKQVMDSGIILDSEDQELLEENGSIYYPVRLENNICSACGSDQDYDDEGNNISSR